MDLRQALEQAAKQGAAQQERILHLNDYLDLVKANPTVSASAHARVFDMVTRQGSQPGAQPEEVSYNFFADELF
ncbi:MAG: PrkA domain, partial [Trebonia sp.]|nr:PrkA domain [Trebonia sp.]